MRLLLRLLGTGSSPNFDANRVCLSLSNLTLFRTDFLALSGGEEGFSFDTSLVTVFRVSIGFTVCRAGTDFFGMVDLTSYRVTFLTQNFILPHTVRLINLDTLTSSASSSGSPSSSVFRFARYFGILPYVSRFIY